MDGIKEVFGYTLYGNEETFYVNCLRIDCIVMMNYCEDRTALECLNTLCRACLLH